MRPQGPLNSLFERLSAIVLTPEQYTIELLKHLKDVQECIAMDLEAVHDRKVFKRSLEFTIVPLDVGKWS